MDIFASLVGTLEHYSVLAYLTIFLAAFLESLAFVGLVIPGTTIIVAMGFLNSQGSFHFTPLVLSASIGVIVGNGISFYLGRYGHRFFKEDNKFFKLDYLKRGTDFIHRHGLKSIFLGHFTGPLRAVVPFLSGMFKMRMRKFFFYNSLSAIVWSVCYLAIGYFFGAVWQAISAWSTRLAIFIFWVLLFLSVFYLLRWFFIKKGKSVILFFFSLGRSVWEGIKDNPNIKAFMLRHPGLVSFLKKRSEKGFYGQTLTVLSVAFIYAFWTFITVIYNITKADFTQDIDLSLDNLLYAFRNPILTKFFLWITLFGKWQVVLAVALAAALLFILWKKREYCAAFFITLAGGVGFAQLAKLFWHRPRPGAPLPVYFEHSWSFPSAHAVVAVCLYGFLTYYLIKNLYRWRNRINALFAGLFLIVFIGFSRLYLGVHFLSDVWAGYMIGIMWLLVGIGIVEWYGERHKLKPGEKTPNAASDWQRSPFKMKIITASVLAAVAGVYLTVGIAYKPQLNLGEEDIVPTRVETNNVAKIFDNYNLPKFTETLLGNKQEPFSFIIVAKDDETLVKDFTDAGWYLADDVSMTSLGMTLKSEIWNKPYDTAPITPYFWRTYMHDFGFQRPTEQNSARNRHHARFWETNFENEKGENVYVGVASLDTGVKWWGLTHRIRPDIDTDREYLFNNLMSSGKVDSFEKIQLTDRVLGTNFTGDLFFTDGQAYVIYLK
jgi:membrane protein DedA with SNARE-associated domain/membrane-associated phospholipid phosphatase